MVNSPVWKEFAITLETAELFRYKILARHTVKKPFSTSCASPMSSFGFYCRFCGVFQAVFDSEILNVNVGTGEKHENTFTQYFV